jgi:hypothetical protein
MRAAAAININFPEMGSQVLFGGASPRDDGRVKESVTADHVTRVSGAGKWNSFSGTAYITASHAQAQLELLQDVAHMVLHGLLANEHPLADLTVVRALRDNWSTSSSGALTREWTPAAHRSGTPA